MGSPNPLWNGTWYNKQIWDGIVGWGQTTEDLECWKSSLMNEDVYMGS